MLFRSNAAVCKGDFGRMTVGDAGGPIGFSLGGGGARAAAGAAATPAAPQPPVVLSRNGKEYPATGETNVRAGNEYKVATERSSLPLNVKELDAGSWVMFELPGFNTADSGAAVDSLDALRGAAATSYYKANGSLWVKIVSSGDILGSGPTQGPGPGDSLMVSR